MVDLDTANVARTMFEILQDFLVQNCDDFLKKRKLHELLRHGFSFTVFSLLGQSFEKGMFSKVCFRKNCESPQYRAHPTNLSFQCYYLL